MNSQFNMYNNSYTLILLNYFYYFSSRIEWLQVRFWLSLKRTTVNPVFSSYRLDGQTIRFWPNFQHQAQPFCWYHYSRPHACLQLKDHRLTVFQCADSALVNLRQNEYPSNSHEKGLGISYPESNHLLAPLLPMPSEPLLSTTTSFPRGKQLLPAMSLKEKLSTCSR